MNTSMSVVDRSSTNTPRLLTQLRAALANILATIRRLTSGPNYLGEIGGF